jgi:hypothetical protein
MPERDGLPLDQEPDQATQSKRCTCIQVALLKLMQPVANSRLEPTLHKLTQVELTKTGFRFLEESCNNIAIVWRSSKTYLMYLITPISPQPTKFRTAHKLPTSESSLQI